jgi:hypothetical protein
VAEPHQGDTRKGLVDDPTTEWQHTTAAKELTRTSSFALF